MPAGRKLSSASGKQEPLTQRLPEVMRWIPARRMTVSPDWIEGAAPFPPTALAMVFQGAVELPGLESRPLTGSMYQVAADRASGSASRAAALRTGKAAMWSGQCYSARTGGSTCWLLCWPVVLKKTAIVLAIAIPALWMTFERASGPSREPLPATLPHIVRRPPPLARAWDSAKLGINPTEEVRRLHAQGITGRHVGIAILDSFLLTEHSEYRDRLRWYDEIDGQAEDPAGWHGTATASIAAGRTLGVAPESDLYFTGLGLIWARQPIGNWFVAARRATHIGQSQAVAIRRILEMNRRLPPERKIRVISMSIGWGPPVPLLNDTKAAVEEARGAGIFVASLELRARPFGPVKIASAAGPERYITVGAAGSWSIAYWAGRYALACQQDRAMTPERFLKTIFQAETR